MSDLRKKLQSAREEYRSQRYPGDLAAELLPEVSSRRTTVLKILTAAAAVSGIAAAILLWVTSRSPLAPTAPASPVAVRTTQPTDEDDAVMPVTALAAVPEFPQDIPMAPSLDSSDDTRMAPSFESIEIGSIPSMPSLDMSFTDTETQTSKEST